AFIVTFLIIILRVHLLATAIEKVIKAASLGIVNKSFGALFSALKTVLVLSVVFMVVNAFDEHFHFMPEKTVEESSLYSPIADIVPAIFPTLGEGGLLESFERLRENIEDQE
ncbi:MAG: CvpA family protein, partial [Bacteroidales bacterium]|nr:CvpA family protein [Bacteroidales bacterium]